MKLAKSRLGRRYHYRPPPANHRLLLGAPSPQVKGMSIADSVDLRKCFGPVRDQGQEGSCSGFATAAFREAIEPGDCPTLSPAYLYGRTRQAEGTFPADSGCTLADEFGTLLAHGVCPEEFLPYRADPSEAPTPACDVAAARYRIGQPLCVDTSEVDDIKRVLSAGKPIAIGFIVHPSFESTGSDGMVPAPELGEPVIGGHAVVLCGYDSTGWTIRNSWGPSWARQGYCTMPYGYESTWLEAWTA